jgi:ribonuclease E
VELTRKRQGKNLYELFGQTCPHCGGTGHIVYLPGEDEPEKIEAPTVNIPAIALRPTIEPVTPPIKVVGLEPDLSFNEPYPEFTPTLEKEPFDLLNHPSYQEQGMGAAARRRRRRRLPDGTEESGFKVSAAISPSEGDRTVIRPPQGTSMRPTPNGSFRDRRDRISRSHYNEEINYERVSVEMTPMEQEIYALMGVSPLLRLEREFKELKSVIVSVKLTDESIPTTQLSFSIDEDLEEDQDEDQFDEENNDSLDQLEDFEDQVDTEPIDELESSEDQEDQEESDFSFNFNLDFVLNQDLNAEPTSNVDLTDNITIQDDFDTDQTPELNLEESNSGLDFDQSEDENMDDDEMSSGQKPVIRRRRRRSSAQ